MNLKHIVVAAAFALAASAPAFADTVETVASYGPKTINRNTPASELTTGLFQIFTADTDFIFSGLVSKTTNSGTDKYLTASLLDALNNVVSSFTIQSNPASNVDKTFASGPLSLSAGFYKIVFDYHTVGSSNPIFHDTSASLTHTVTAVPGPEAGAGLGALAMGGIALYMKRRRKEDAAAA